MPDNILLSNGAFTQRNDNCTNPTANKLIRNGDNDRISDLLMVCYNCFNLSQLNSISPAFDHMVLSTHEYIVPIAIKGDQVTSPVNPLRYIRGERVLDKARLGFFGFPQIPQGDRGPPDI